MTAEPTSNVSSIRIADPCDRIDYPGKQIHTYDQIDVLITVVNRCASLAENALQHPADTDAVRELAASTRAPATVMQDYFRWFRDFKCVENLTDTQLRIERQPHWQPWRR